ncbi:MAG: transposase [Lachnospiraceae bacterium]
MGEKDITEKTLEAYNDVFADIINVLLFNGKQTVKENELEDAIVRYHYKADKGKLHEMERDTAKYWKDSNIRIACIGYENQTAPDTDAPLRGAAYDGSEYRRQMLADYEKITDADGIKKVIKKRKPRYPVITLFLYFGYKKQWDKPLELHGCLDIPEELKPYVNNYKINLFEIAYLTEEQVSLFKSDFRIVADYFVQMRKNNHYVAKPETIKHVHELLELMSVLTDDRRFMDVCGVIEKEDVNMCEVLDQIENRGIEQGIKQGMEQGIGIGMDIIIKLSNILVSAGRTDDLKRAETDRPFLEELIQELLPEEK